MLQYAEYAQQVAPATDAETLARRAKLYTKINKVIVELKRVAKNGRNTFFNYSYATESDLVDAIRNNLEEVALALLPPIVLGYEIVERPKAKGGMEYIARVTLQYGLADCETGEVQTAILIAEGADSVDKAFYKAYSGGTKYFLMKTFLVSTGDDPEQEAPTLRDHLLSSLRELVKRLPDDKRAAYTKASVNAMSDQELIAASAALLEETRS
jgi:hypothetical protein